MRAIAVTGSARFPSLPQLPTIAESGLPGYDAAVQTLSGLMSINGDPALDPVRIGIPLVDTTTGMNAATGVLLALSIAKLDPV